MHRKGRVVFFLVSALVANATINVAAETAAEIKLLHLAREQFTNGLSVGEENMLRATANGVSIEAIAASEKETNPANSANWHKDRTIRAECLRWLCTDLAASELVSSRGIGITGLRIEGVLDLAWARIKFPLHVRKCAFTEGIILQHCWLSGLYLEGTHIRGLLGDDMKIEEDVMLTDGFKSEGMMQITQATIGGDLDCHAGQFINTNGGIAFLASGSRIAGDLVLSGLKADGEVRVMNANIGGDFACVDGHLEKKGGLALCLDGTAFGGSVFLRDIKVEGETRLVGTKIGADLDCSGGKFLHKSGVAIFGDGAKVEGSVLLCKSGDENFIAEGEVRFLSATILSPFVCSGGHFTKSNGVALALDSTEFKRGVFLNERFNAEGEVRLLTATIGANLECDGGTFSNPQKFALNADGLKIEGGIFLRNGFKAQGTIQLVNALVNGNLDCSHGQFIEPQAIALTASGIQVKGSVLLNNAKVRGTMKFPFANISGNLECAGGQFFQTNVNSFAIGADGSKIEGSILFRDNCEVIGRATFIAANVGRIFQWISVKSVEQATLDLHFATAGILWDEERSWPKQGNLHLDGFSYGRINADSPVDAQSRIKWLMLQPQSQFLPQPYEQLASTLRNMGHGEAAAEVMIAKNEDYARRLPWHSISRLWYNFIGRLAGFGYLPGRAFMISLAFIIVGTILYRHARLRDDIVLSDSERRHTSIDAIKADPQFNAFVYSLETFVPLLELDMAQHWNARPGSWLRGYYYFHRIFGWILTTLWIGALTGLVKT